MSIIDEIKSANSGALFRRADLHIHSYGGSYDVTDQDMTPKNIVNLALEEGLEVISITDHNSIDNIAQAINYAKGKPILVLPGVELSTPQGHLLVYCPDNHMLQRFYGKLDISPDKKLCRNTITQCLDEAIAFSGIGIVSHIDTEAGFEKAVSGYGPFKEDIVKCPNLLAMEITSIANESWYTERDEHSERKRIFHIRRENILEDNGYDMAKVLFSDAHTLTALGKNASGNKKITRLKMDSLKFDSFKISLMDATARVRIEELIPTSIPHFVGIKYEGGFLDGQTIKFSKNLTCIIGGRGTGKSTAIEALRATSGNEARENLLDSEVWPDRALLIWKDEAGREQLLCRDKLNNVINLADSENGLTYIPIESYGQGETAETIQHCDKDPNVLLTFLDGFIDFGTLKNEDEETCRQLLENQTQIERYTIEVNSIPDIDKALKNAIAQLDALKAQKASEVIELEGSLAKERSFRTRLVNKLKELISTLRSAFSDNSIKELVEELNGTPIVAGINEFNNVKKLLDRLSSSIANATDGLNKETNKVIDGINEQLKVWMQKEKDIYSRIENIRRTLQEKGIKLDMAFIRKTTSDVSHYSTKLKELDGKKNELKELWKSRKQLLRERFAIKSRIFTLRNGFATSLNANLRVTVVDYLVTLKFREGLFSDSCQRQIQEAMDWRTSQVPRAEYISKQITIPELIEVIRTKNITRLQTVKDLKGVYVFSKTDASLIVERLNNMSVFFALERCPFEDRPEITVTRMIKMEDGTEIPLKKDFSKLSLGQQQSILLSILLFSKSNKPLVIDQPEDNLDSEFIYRTLVRNLRRVKEHRQVIIVTHNANIAVLGDAELIIPLRSTSDKSIIIDRGSIDNPSTKTITCTILEGSEQAFKKRKNIYGI